jgi:FkbH-like protein
LLSLPFQFAIGATFTADPLASSLAFWGRQLDAQFDIRFAPYHQLPQTLLDPNSDFARNTHGVNVALIRIEDLGQFSDWGPATRAAIEDNLRSLLNTVRGAMLRLPVPLIFSLCPPSDAAAADPAVKQWLESMEALTEHFLEDASRVHRLTFAEVLRHYPMARWNDPDAEKLGRIPYSDEFFVALGTSMVRLAHALFQPPYKVIVFDCDNTLWNGVCGEDGPDGVGVDGVRRELHQFAIEKREDGALLAMASKNNESDVLDTFAAHPQMPLKLSDFVAWRINWEPKANNLVELASELSLGIDSFVLIDDNPRECAEVEDALPQVLSLTLPADTAKIPHFLRHVWAFDRPVVTEEDRRRNAYYRQAQEFGRESRKAESFDQFLASLNLRVELFEPSRDTLARIAQLTFRTNQFNLTTVRRTEGEIQALLAEPGVQLLGVRVSDRFGDYGIVGVVVTRDTRIEAEIDTFLLSCRVLGRGVEHRILSEVARRASQRRLAMVKLRWVPSARNLPARQFLESVLGSAIHPDSEFVGSASCESLFDLRYTKPIAALPVTEAAPTPSAQRRFLDYARIANELSTASQILEALREMRSGGDGAAAHAQEYTETEARLAAIWRDLLETPYIARNANFFDAGGHSLLAVMLIVRVKEAFGIELPVEDVYSPSMTLEELALKLEGYQLSGIDPDRYADLLTEIEQLSDEEVHRLLEQEGFEQERKTV